MFEIKKMKDILEIIEDDKIVVEEVDEMKYPVLKKYNISLHSPLVHQQILCKMLHWNKYVLGNHVLEVELWNDKRVQLVSFPKGKTINRQVMNDKYANWMTNCFKAFGNVGNLECSHENINKYCFEFLCAIGTTSRYHN